MSDVTTSMPAPVWLRELSEARATYQELLGWPVSVQVGARNLAVCTGPALAALDMPAALGARVRAELDDAIVSTPIIANADGSRWTFLARPSGPLGPSVADDLAGAQVTLAPPGSYVVVPSGLAPRPVPEPRWVAGPQPHQALPSLQAVIGLARRLVDARSQMPSAA